MHGIDRAAILLPRKISPGLAVRTVLLATVIGYAALLRFDALTLTYGSVERPGWLRAVQASRGVESVLRPSSVRWDRWQGRYISDPYTYLQYARETRSFYSAHPREPVFPFATKIFLNLLSDQDIAVSFTSMFFSTLGVIGTFVLGYYAFSYWVGLAAAAAMAIEFDVITWGVGGWRDDAFTCAVVFSAWAMLRYARLGSSGTAILLGAFAGFACLVRVTALLFVLPGLVWAVTSVKRSWPRRVKHAVLMIVTALVIAAPYFVNCWRVYGDPLLAINVHVDVYRETESPTVGGSSQTAAQYVRSKFRSHPWQSIDTAVLGLTEYPFTNKWNGFGVWHSELGKLLSWSALVGLFLFAGSREGRLLLVVLACSLVPYMMTWKLIHDWRFTLHAYPFFLIAAAYTIAAAARIAYPRHLKAYLSGTTRLAVLGWTAAALGVAAGVGITARVMPVLVAKEALLQGEPVTIMAGVRDTAFFGTDWWPAEATGNVTARVTGASGSTLWLPLPDVRDYQLTMRFDPFPRPLNDEASRLPVVQAHINGLLLEIIDTTWNPERVGTYTLSVPKNLLNEQRNRLQLSARTKSGGPARVRLWYVRIFPGPPS